MGDMGNVVYLRAIDWGYLEVVTYKKSVIHEQGCLGGGCVYKSLSVTLFFQTGVRRGCNLIRSYVLCYVPGVCSAMCAAGVEI